MNDDDEYYIRVLQINPESRLEHYQKTITLCCCKSDPLQLESAHLMARHCQGIDSLDGKVVQSPVLFKLTVTETDLSVNWKIMNPLTETETITENNQ